MVHMGRSAYLLEGGSYLEVIRSRCAAAQIAAPAARVVESAFREAAVRRILSRVRNPVDETFRVDLLDHTGDAEARMCELLAGRL